MARICMRIGQVALVVAVWAGPALAADTAPQKAASDFDAASGWRRSCASCHGVDGRGSPKMAKILAVDVGLLDMTSAAVAKMADADLAKVIGEGNPTNKKMASYRAKYKPAEIAALVAHLRSFSTKISEKADAADATHVENEKK